MWFEHAQRRDWLGRRVYRLSMALDVDDIEREVIEAHRLGEVELWVSPTVLALEAEADTALEKSRGLGGWSFRAIGTKLAEDRHGMTLLREAQHEGRVTVADVVQGTTLEARYVGELMECEAGVRAAFEKVIQLLDVLVDYEDGSELVIDPPEPNDRGVPPSGWVRMAKR